MIQNQIPTDRKTQIHRQFYLLIIFYLISAKVTAQQKVYSNVFIPSEGQATVFGVQNFADNAQILTARNTTNGTLTVAQNVQITNANANSFVDGAVRKLGTTPFIFPVGHGAFYGPVAASGDATTAIYFHSDPTDALFPVAARESTLAFVSSTEYWLLKGSNDTPITLTWNESSGIEQDLTDIGNLKIVGWKAGIWTEISSAPDVNSILGGASTLASGSITSTDAIRPNDFDAFSIGAISAVLPVTLIDFNAKKESNTAMLSWTTSFETGSDHFQVERSKDGKTWHSIGIVKSIGESSALHGYRFTDPSPLKGENYYRLKMVDWDGTFAFSSVRTLQFERALEHFVLYPNPAKNILNIQSPILDSVKRKQISITDLNGHNYDRSIKWYGDDLSIEKLKNGIYILTFLGESGQPLQSKFVIQK
jgi:hypothetical protein